MIQADKRKTVYLIGSQNKCVDQFRLWNFKYMPNVFEPDILIIDLTTLTKELLSANQHGFEILGEAILNKIFNEGVVIVITHPQIQFASHMFNNIGSEKYSNYFFCAVSLETIQVNKGKPIIHDKFLFKKYAECLKTYSFFLNIQSASKSLLFMKGSNANSKDFLKIIKSQMYSYSGYNFEFPHFQVKFLPEYELLDNGNNTIGCGIQLQVQKAESGKLRTISGGKVIFLPPPSDSTREDVIDLLLEDLGISETEELLPDWINYIPINGLDKINKRLAELDQEKKKIIQLIDETIIKKKNIENYYNLVTSQGRTLENTVATAFKELGFMDINNDRGPEYEDWRFEFSSKETDNQVIGVIEVFGTDGSASERKLSQLQKWVDDYELGENRDTKGIFIVNQYRKKTYPDSKDERLKFDPRYIKFAEKRDICIIPTIFLFDLINRKFGGENIEKNILEEKILKSSGVIESF